MTTHEYHAIYTSGGPKSDENGCSGIQISALPDSKPAKLVVHIFGPDQDAMEFLTHKQFDAFVNNTRRLMEWK